MLLERGHGARRDPAARLGVGVNSYVDAHTIEGVNAAIAEPREQPYTYESFPYRVDGVVHSVDGRDGNHEFKDFTLLNVAVYGHVRIENGEGVRSDEKVGRSGAVLYVGLEARKLADGRWAHKLVRFSSSMITKRKYTPPDTAEAFLVCAWVVGRVVDPSASPEMLTVHVDVRPLRPLKPEDATDYQPKNPIDFADRYSYVRSWKYNPSTRRHEPAVFGEPLPRASVSTQLLDVWQV